MSRVYLLFTDHEGDPLALTNEISAVYVTAEKEQVKSFLGQEPVRELVKESYRVVHHSTGSYRVRETFDEVMDKIRAATECE